MTMNRFPAAFVLAVAVSLPAAARDGLEDFLGSVNVRAQANMPGFYATVSTQFGAPEAQVRMVLSTVGEPSSAFMIFQLGQMAHQPVNRVLEVYRNGRNTGKGWGMMAKELGIKPGSREFHALKNGEFTYGAGGHDGGPGRSGDNPGRGHGKGRRGD